MKTESGVSHEEGHNRENENVNGIAAAAVVGFSCSAGRTHQSHHCLPSLKIFMGKIAAQGSAR